MGNTTQVTNFQALGVEPTWTTSITFGSACGYAFPETFTNPKGHSTTLAYDCALGKPTSVTNPNSVLTQYTWGAAGDAKDRLVSVINASGRPEATVTSYAYNDVAGSFTMTATQQQQSCNLGEDIVTTTKYDGLGRAIERTSPDGTGPIVTTTVYDALGRVARQSNPYRPGETPNYTDTVFDGLGRSVAVTTTADGATTRLGYALEETYARDAADKWKKTLSDGLGRLVRVVEDPVIPADTAQNPSPIPGFVHASGLSYETTYTYDARDQLRTVTQGAQSRQFTYDGLGRLTKAINPESGTIDYVYNGDGTLRTKTHSGVEMALAYDALQRVVFKSYTGGTVATPAVLFCYDGNVAGACAGAPTAGLLKGQMTMVKAFDLLPANNHLITTYSEHDGLGRVGKSEQSFSSAAADKYALTYSYNKAGGLELETYPSLSAVKTCYDKGGRPISALKSSNGLIYGHAAAYAAHGGMKQLTLGNGVVENWDYNGRLQTTLAKATKSAAVLLELGFTYGGSDNAGNAQTQTITHRNASGGTVFNATQVYNYDPLNRLGGVSEGAGKLTQTFAYDQWGNRALTAGWNPKTAAAALTAYDMGKNQWPIGGFDARGNQTAAMGWAHQYDAENRLTHLNHTVGDLVTYQYDGNGRRVRKASTLGTVRFVYDAMGQLVGEYGGAASPATLTYLSGDHLGTTRLVTDANGTVLKRYDYAPFGEEIPKGQMGRPTDEFPVGEYPATVAQADGVAPKFTGQVRDAETGLDYFGARYMSSVQGRFTSPDPIFANVLRVINPQRWNTYAYAVNSPLVFTDPDGRDAIAVKFSNLAKNLGHSGVASVHRDGTGTFADFGPKHAGQAHDAGDYRFADFKTKLVIGADGKATIASLSALANELADIEQQPHDSVSIAYFKTSDAETAALDAYISAARAQKQKGTTPTYLVGFRDCIGFCMNGLEKAGIGRGASSLTIPNLQYIGLWLAADRTATGTNPPKEEVTSRICDPDGSGRIRCK